MIRRLFCLWGGCECRDTARRVRMAQRAFEASDSRLRSVALDTINRSMPDVEPFRPDQLNEAIAEVIRRTGPHHPRRLSSSGDDEALADDALRLTDRP